MEENGLDGRREETDLEVRLDFHTLCGPCRALHRQVLASLECPFLWSRPNTPSYLKSMTSFSAVPSIVLIVIVVPVGSPWFFDQQTVGCSEFSLSHTHILFYYLRKIVLDLV